MVSSARAEKRPPATPTVSTDRDDDQKEHQASASILPSRAVTSSSRQRCTCAAGIGRAIR